MMKILQSIAYVLGWISIGSLVIIIVYAIIKCSRWYKKEVVDYVDNEMKHENDVRETPHFKYSEFFDN